jgi:hypothetical protein
MGCGVPFGEFLGDVKRLRKVGKTSNHKAQLDEPGNKSLSSFVI